MKLIKYDYPYADPFASLERLLDQTLLGMDRDALTSRFYDTGVSSNLAVNVYQDGDNYHVTAELPGFDKKDIKVELENAVLTVSGTRKVKRGEQESEVRFNRSITVGDDINPNKVKAKLSDGILTITLPKHEERKPKAISVS